MSLGRAPLPRVFVYGTLMRAQPNHRVLVEVGARFVAEARTREPRTLVDLGPYPALLPRDADAGPDAGADAGASRVAGELYEVDDDALGVLDEFEGCPDLYTRERIALEDASAEGDADADAGLDAWTYVLARAVPPHARVVAGGRYRGGGRVLAEGAREVTDLLDNEATNEDGSRSREPKRTRGPR